MKIWTCGSSPRSGFLNTWTRIKTSTVPVVWVTFGNFSARSKWFHVGRDWWSWTKPGYITMTGRQSNWRHSGSTRPKKFRLQRSAGKVLASIFWDQDGILVIHYIPKGQTINAEYYSSLLVQLKDILKEKRCGKVIKGVLFLHDKPPGSTGTCNPEETGLPGLPVSSSPTLFSGSGSVGLPPVPWTEKTIERSPFFVRREGHCCRRDLVGRTIFWFFFSGLQKLEERTKKCIELRMECVE